MTSTKTCNCECHNGKHLYHVRWKACCVSPVDGGKPKKVYGCTMKDGEVCFLIAQSKDEVIPFWKAEFGLDPIEDSVAEATEGR